MRDSLFVIQHSDLQSLTPAQRHELIGQLMRQAHKARARAIGEALLRLASALCIRFGRAHEPAVQRVIARR